jgi:hypothetical protein
LAIRNIICKDPNRCISPIEAKLPQIFNSNTNDNELDSLRDEASTKRVCVRIISINTHPHPPSLPKRNTFFIFFFFFFFFISLVLVGSHSTQETKTSSCSDQTSRAICSALSLY